MEQVQHAVQNLEKADRDRTGYDTDATGATGDVNGICRSGAANQIARRRPILDDMFINPISSINYFKQQRQCH